MTDNVTYLDVKGLMCPLPVLKARKALKAMTSGATLRLVATDPASVLDVPHFCNETGHDLVAQTESSGVFTYDIRKK